MATEEKKPGGPDLSAGVAAAELTRGAVLTGHVGDDEVLLVRQGGKLFALSAYCTHYHGPLADGLSWARRSAALGTMRTSTCRPAKLLQRRP